MGGAERRGFPRHAVQGVVAEITNVIGRGDPTAGATLVNWSQSGMLLRVPSPRRRLFLRRGRALAERDLVACTLRLPPHGEPVAIKADVRRVRRSAEDPDWLEVGVAFDREVTPPQFLVAMASALDPQRTCRATARLNRWSSRTRRGSQRPESDVEAESERLARPASDRVRRR
ncbi:MAG: PilZ domain-containing protein [Planctomycetes bacterium]|nr:PilZ domain-containing protein [Planctomycetota bacterium]